MTETTTTPTFFERLASEQLALFFLIGLSLFIALARYHTYDEPLEHDITATAVIANEMRLGRQYYSDVWENKPPALYIVHIMAQSVFGYGRGSLFAINLTLSLMSLFGVYFAASRGGGNIVSGLWAAVFWTVTSGDLDLQANQPNTEAFMNAPLIWAFALLLSLDRSEGRARVIRAVLVGALVALCSFYKPHSVVYGVFLGLSHILFPPEATPIGRKRAITDVLIIGGTGAIAWLAFLAYFALTGRGQILYTTMLVYPRYYSGNMLWNLWFGLGSQLYPTQLHLITPLVFLTLAGGVIAWKSGLKRPWALLIAYAVATQFTIAAPGRFYIHYYQLWLPIVAVGAGWSVVLLGQAIKEQFKGWLPHVFAAIALLFMLPPEIWAYRMDPVEWSQKSYGGVYVASERLASNLNDVLQPNETLFVLGDEPNFYFITGRRPAVGTFFLQDIASGPLADEFSVRMINDLNRKPPDLVVIQNSAIGPKTVGPKNARLGPDHPVRKWVSDNYCPVDTNPFSFFTICAKPGGSIEQRPSYRRLAAILSANVP